MQIANADDVSLVCQFNIDNDSTSIKNLIDVTEELFIELGYPIKKIYYYNGKKVYAPSYKRFKLLKLEDMNEVSGLSFRSDFNSKDFEPNTRLDIEVNMRYIHSNNVAKLSVVINDSFFIDDIFNAYKRIIAVFADNSYQLTLSGYSFLLPNYYGAVSFSSGILRKFNMPCSLKNLASWYSNADLVNGTLGLLNCFSDLSVEQNKYLFNIFGEKNVYVTNNITAVYNVAAESKSIADYIESDDYNCKCLKLEKKLPFKKLNYYPGM